MKNIVSFRKKVYTVTKKIPKGKVATYGQIAQLAGKPRAARAVGMYMKRNPYAPVVPCHRVVASDGALTGYSGRGGIKGKLKLLQKEGVYFTDHHKAKVDLKKSLWGNDLLPAVPAGFPFGFMRIQAVARQRVYPVLLARRYTV